MVREDVGILPNWDWKKSLDAFVAIIPEVPGLTEEQKKKIRENAQELPIEHEISFEDAIKLLLSARNEGKNCFIVINEVPYYSVDIATMDDAYLQREWMTKTEREARKLQTEREIARGEQVVEAAEAKKKLI